MIAALSDLHVGKMFRREPEPRRFKVGDENRAAVDLDERFLWGGRAFFSLVEVVFCVLS
jgi:hypothetical protein